MNAGMMTCPMCGHRFDPRDHIACQACPLQKGCQLVCCPACGFEMVDIEQSALARFATQLLRSGHKGSSPEDQPTWRGAQK